MDRAKKDFFDPERDDNKDCKSTDEILDELELSRGDHEETLPISSDEDFKIHLKKLSKSCFVTILKRACWPKRQMLTFIQSSTITKQ